MSAPFRYDVEAAVRRLACRAAPENAAAPVLSQLSQPVATALEGLDRPQRGGPDQTTCCFATYNSSSAMRAVAAESDLSQLSQLSRGALSGPGNPDDARDAFEERAAIMEHEGGLTRAEAERCARLDLDRR